MRKKERYTSNFALFWESFDFLNSFSESTSLAHVSDALPAGIGSLTCRVNESRAGRFTSASVTRASIF